MAVSGAETASVLGAGAISPGSTKYSFRPKSPDYIYLLVGFQLKAESIAGSLDAQDIVLIVDGSARVPPVGFKSAWEEYVGKFTGTFTPEGADLHVDFEVEGAPGAPGGGRGLKTNSLSHTFIYLVPRKYLDGQHRLELQTLGSDTGITFTVEPLPLPQGHVALSADGNYVAVARDKSLYLFEVRDNEPLWSYTGDYPLRPPIISADGSYVLAVAQKTSLVGGPHVVMLFEKGRSTPLWAMEFQQYQTAEMSLDGSRVAVAARKDGGDYLYVDLFATNSGELIGMLKDKDDPFSRGAMFSVSDIALSANGDIVAVAGNTYGAGEALLLFDGSAGSELWRYVIRRNGTFRDFQSVAMSPDGQYVGAVYKSTNTAPKLEDWTRIFTVSMFRRDRSVPVWEHTETGDYADYSIDLSPDGNTALVRAGPHLTLFNTIQGVPLWSKTADDFESLISSTAVSGDGAMTAVGCRDDSVYLLDRSGSMLWRRDDLGNKVSVSRNGATLAVSSRTAVYLVSAQDLSVMWTYPFP